MVARYMWLAKSCRPLSMPENDKPFKTLIKMITYGRYTPPLEATCHSELCKLHAETEIIISGLAGIIRWSRAAIK